MEGDGGMDEAAGVRPIPDFAIVGAPRSGTTLMWRALGAHPQICMSSVKEPHHFSTDLDSGSEADRGAFTRSRATYLSYFAGARSEQLTGEASAWYLYSAVAARNLRAANERARIIIQLRDPVHMLHSLYQLRRYLGTEDIATFEDALAAEDDRRLGRRLPAGARNLKTYYYRDVARYCAQVARYIDAFGRDAVKVFVAEEMWADRATAYRAALDFLGVDPGFVPELRRANAAAVRRSQRLQAWLGSSRLRSAARSMLPRGMPGRLAHVVDRLNTATKPSPPLDPATEARLREELSDDVAALGELLGRDLARVWWRVPGPAR